MNPEAYLQSELQNLQVNTDVEKPVDLEDFIFKTVMSHKFRKYSANPELQAHIKEAIHENVAAGKPINVTFLHGAYKLWRLEESPEADWAELFACMYYTNWVKPICAVYEPGVWFDFFVDDLIVPKLDNIDPKEIDAYIASYQGVLDFLKPYQPANFNMTITPVGSRFASPQAFDESLERNIQKIMDGLPNGIPPLTDKQRAMVELNAKPTPEQLEDPEWREKVHLIHDAYLLTKKESGYTAGTNKILVFSQPLPSGTFIAVGTTKDSVAKFWVGVGVLKPKDNSYRQVIYSPSQLEGGEFDVVPVEIPGLEGKNFRNIRVVK